MMKSSQKITWLSTLLISFNQSAAMIGSINLFRNPQKHIPYMTRDAPVIMMPKLLQQSMLELLKHRL